MRFSRAVVGGFDGGGVGGIGGGTGGLRLGGGGRAACWRVAGCMAGAALAAAGAFLITGEAGEAAVFGTTLRAIGRGLGSGTFGAARASAARPGTPTLSARAMPNAMRCNAVRCTALFCTGDSEVNRVTAFFRGESAIAVFLALFH